MKNKDYGLMVKRLRDWGYTPDLDVQTALLKYQSAYKDDLNILCIQFHGRELNVDGVMGPATRLFMDSRTCNTPDFLNREEARWPDACKDHITVSWNFDKAPGLSEKELDEVWLDVKREYEKYFQLQLKLSPEDYPNTRIYAALKALPGSTLAWSYLANNSCASRLQQAYDNTISWSKKLAIGTWKHEVGHALGMQHTPNDRNSLMYPSMNGQTGLNETDIQQMLRLGYKRRETPIPPPEEPTDSVSTVITVNGTEYKYTWSSVNPPPPFPS